MKVSGQKSMDSTDEFAVKSHVKSGEFCREFEKGGSEWSKVGVRRRGISVVNRG
jgi:hypothetical protein